MSENSTSPTITVATDLTEFFIGRISDVLQRQKKEASQESQKYLAGLLSHFALTENLHAYSTGADEEVPSPRNVSDVFMAVTHFAEKQPSMLLKRAGDYSLYMTGFFPGSMKFSWFNDRHFREMGIRAYEMLATRNLSSDLKLVFKEMSHHFVDYTHIISEIQLDAEGNRNEALVNLFESWNQYGNKVGLEVLLRKGLTPVIPETKMVS